MVQITMASRPWWNRKRTPPTATGATAGLGMQVQRAAARLPTRPAVMPPSMTSPEPVTRREASEAGKSTPSATSEPGPVRPAAPLARRWRGRPAGRCGHPPGRPAGSLSQIGVPMVPGWTELTRKPSRAAAHSGATDLAESRTVPWWRSSRPNRPSRAGRPRTASGRRSRCRRRGASRAWRASPKGNAVQVGRRLPAPIGQRHAHGRAHDADARVGHQDAQAAEQALGSAATSAQRASSVTSWWRKRASRPSSGAVRPAPRRARRPGPWGRPWRLRAPGFPHRRRRCRARRL